MHSINYQKLANLISECTKTLSKKSVQRTILTTLSASLATGITVKQIEKQKTKKKISKIENENLEKSRLIKEALVKQEAINEELKAVAEMSKERQDYLVDLNNRLMEQIEECKKEDIDENK